MADNFTTHRYTEGIFGTYDVDTTATVYTGYGSCATVLDQHWSSSSSHKTPTKCFRTPQSRRPRPQCWLQSDPPRPRRCLPRVPASVVPHTGPGGDPVASHQNHPCQSRLQSQSIVPHHSQTNEPLLSQSVDTLRLNSFEPLHSQSTGKLHSYSSTSPDQPYEPLNPLKDELNIVGTCRQLTLCDVRDHNRVDGGHHWSVWNGHVYDTTSVLRHWESTIDGDSDKDSLRSLMEQYPNRCIFILGFYGINRRERDQSLTAYCVGALDQSNVEKSILLLEMLLDTFKATDTTLEAESEGALLLFDVCQRHLYRLTINPCTTKSSEVAEEYINNNASVFPLPRGVHPAHLRHWLSSWEPFDQDISRGESVWDESFHVDHASTEAAPSFADSLRPWVDEWEPFDMEVSTEAAWETIPHDIIKCDVILPSQENILFCRESRKYFGDPDLMRKRRENLTNYFLTKYNYPESKLALYSDWSERLEGNQKLLEELSQGSEKPDDGAMWVGRVLNEQQSSASDRMVARGSSSSSMTDQEQHNSSSQDILHSPENLTPKHLCPDRSNQSAPSNARSFCSCATALCSAGINKPFTLCDVRYHNRVDGGHHWSVWNGHVYDTTSVLRHWESTIDGDSDKDSLRSLMEQYPNRCIFILGFYGINRRERDQSLTAYCVGALDTDNVEKSILQLEMLINTFDSRLEAESEGDLLMHDVCQRHLHWLTTSPCSTGNFEEYVHTNASVFPLPRGVDPDQLRHWLSSWEPFDQDISPGESVWAETGGVEDEELADPTSSLPDTLRPWINEWEPFDMEVEGEAAWGTLPLDVIKFDVLLPCQEEIIFSRNSREHLYDSKMVHKRREILFRYFTNKYSYSESKLAPYRDWCKRLVDNQKQLNELCIEIH